MSKSSSSNSVSWSVTADNFIDTEKAVFKSNLGLVLSTSFIALAYSYFGIDKNVSNAVNRALLMALSTFISASAVDLLANNGYIVPNSNNAKYLEGGMIPFLYYGISTRQFALPDVNSQAIKTGVISAVLGELGSAQMQNYVNGYMVPAKAGAGSSKSSY